VTSILGTRVDPTNYRATIDLVEGWVSALASKYVCVANVHVLMEGYDSAEFRGVLNDADLVTADGMPLVWILRLKGYRGAARVYGPTLMTHLLARAALSDIPVGFYGSTPRVIELLTSNARRRFRGLRVTYQYSPPFRAISPEEDASICRDINTSGTRILFVGLGCPKQERWMAAHRGRIHSTMLGVGAAFDFLAGARRQAPPWMQAVGLEWLFRLALEPRRLWRRYLIQNPRFALLAAAELVGLLGS
jgi:N-acetylglucosaminyldiphosphoundecaprenol N-acetyl-beta-D-mannosaminyltransferase